MMNVIYILISIYSLLLSSTLRANTTHPVIDQLQWQLKRSSAEIDVFAATVPESAHRAVLSTTTVNAHIHKVAKIIRDAETCSQWVYRCQSSYRYQRLNAKEDYIYTLSRLPFPVQNRDILAHIKWEQDPVTRMITATGMATTNIVSEQPNTTRIEQARMIWELTPLNDGRTYIRNYAHVDPAGAIPTWLSNSLAIDAPFETMLGLRQLLGESSIVTEEEDN